MLIPVLLFIVGLLCLIKGGDWFVDGATGIARRFHVPELLIGATVVSIGTTLPEVMVSTTSAFTGHGEIAYGNAIGSIICNASLIAALTIAVKPGKVDPKSLRTPVLFFFVAAAFYAGVAYTTGYYLPPGGPDPSGHVRSVYHLQRDGHEERPRPGRSGGTGRKCILCQGAGACWPWARCSLPWVPTCWWTTAP